MKKFVDTEINNHSADQLPQPDLVEYNLSLTPEQRLTQHQNALDTINELKKAGKKLYGESEPTSETST
ncbi:MAG: hypothetical protein KF799_06630 [Bdellovibrionales bacterium]|nr:hypothetical protein [Bdellovibrionales bacterium]